MKDHVIQVTKRKPDKFTTLGNIRQLIVFVHTYNQILYSRT